MLIQWRAKFETGIKEIDGEHRHLAELVNDFYDRYRVKDASANLFILFNELVRYFETHFEHEEALMVEGGYPMYEQHKALHDELARMVFALHEKYMKGEEKVDEKTLEFLKKWLLDHIVQQDMKIGDFLRENPLPSN